MLNVLDLFDSRFGNALFKIENPPSSPQNLQLAADLLTQDRERRIAEDHSCTFALFKNNEIQGGINNRGGVGPSLARLIRVTSLSII